MITPSECHSRRARAGRGVFAVGLVEAVRLRQVSCLLGLGDTMPVQVLFEHGKVTGKGAGLSLLLLSEMHAWMQAISHPPFERDKHIQCPLDD